MTIPDLTSSQRDGVVEGTADVCISFSRLIYGCCCVAEITFIPPFETGGSGQSMPRLTESRQVKTQIKHKLNKLVSFVAVQEGGKPLLEQTGGQGAAALSQHLALLEYHQGGDAANGVASRNGGLLLGIDLDEADFWLKFTGNLLKNR